MTRRPSLARAVHLARRYRNWFALWVGELRGVNPPIMKLRGGPTIVGLDSQVQSIVREVWTRRVYGAPAGGLVVDVGANVGVYSLFAAQAAGHVHAFEPAPENAARLRANLARNGCSNVTVHEVAIGDRSGEVDLFLDEQSGGHGVIEHTPGRPSTSVRIVSFADAVDEHCPGKIALVKMDCEGAEGDALQALHTAHFDRIERFEIEYHDGVSSLTHDQIGALLTQQGFDVSIDRSGDSLGFVHAHRG